MSLKPVLGCFFLALVMWPAKGDAVYKVRSPKVNATENSLEWSGQLDFDEVDDKSIYQRQRLGLARGVNSWWSVKIEGEADKRSDEGYSFNKMKLENKFVPFRSGELPVDVGLQIEYIKELRNEKPDVLDIKLLFEKPFDIWVHTANFAFKHEVGDHADGAGLEGNIALRTKYNHSKIFQPAIEYYADFGQLAKRNPYNMQKHLIGPAMHGNLSHIKYDVGILKGISNSSQEWTAKFNVGYKF